MKSSLALYRVLLRLYSPEFRLQFEPEMTQTFRSLCADSSGRFPAMGLARVWFSILPDLFFTALGTRIQRPSTPVCWDWRARWVKTCVFGALQAQIMMAVLKIVYFRADVPLEQDVVFAFILGLSLAIAQVQVLRSSFRAAVTRMAITSGLGLIGGVLVFLPTSRVSTRFVYLLNLSPGILFLNMLGASILFIACMHWTALHARSESSRVWIVGNLIAIIVPLMMGVSIGGIRAPFGFVVFTMLLAAILQWLIGAWVRLKRLGVVYS